MNETPINLEKTTNRNINNFKILFENPLEVIKYDEDSMIAFDFEIYGSRSDHMKFYDKWIQSHHSILLSNINLFRITSKNIKLY